MAGSGTPALRTDRLDLEPLAVGHAEEMVEVLADASLYTVIGGGPPTTDELRERYRRQVAGPMEDGATWQSWHNWVLRRRDTGTAVGYLQATVTGPEAEVAWVLGPAHQGQGLVTEGAQAMVESLAAAGVTVLSAYVAPGHAPSEAVAGRLGLRPTGERRDGEVRWERRTQA
jgi:RimJ/RimL family protein N-acetyltransferase